MGPILHEQSDESDESSIKRCNCSRDIEKDKNSRTDHVHRQ